MSAAPTLGSTLPSWTCPTGSPWARSTSWASSLCRSTRPCPMNSCTSMGPAAIRPLRTTITSALRHRLGLSSCCPVRMAATGRSPSILVQSIDVLVVNNYFIICFRWHGWRPICRLQRLCLSHWQRRLPHCHHHPLGAHGQREPVPLLPHPAHHRPCSVAPAVLPALSADLSLQSPPVSSASRTAQ